MTIEVLGVGAPVIDRIVQVEDSLLADLGIMKGGMGVVDLPTLEKIERVHHLHSYLIAGGSASNAIKGLAHLGHSCALTGKIGSDLWGQQFLRALSSLNIQPFYVKSTTRTGQILSMVTPDKERTFCSFLGSSNEIIPEELNPSIFKHVKLVHIEGYTLLAPGVTEKAMQLAKKARAKVSFDLASFEIVKVCKAQIASLLPRYVDILFANTQEVSALTGLDPERGCAVLQDLCDTVVVFLGDKGCWVGRGDQRWFIPAIKVAAVQQELATYSLVDLFMGI